MQNVLDVVIRELCNNDGTACSLDTTSPPLVMRDNDVLSVKWQCAW
jgi:hypothetical protein